MRHVDLHAEMHLALATSANTSNYSVKCHVRKLTGTRRTFSSNFAAAAFAVRKADKINLTKRSVPWLSLSSKIRSHSSFVK